MSTSSRHLTMRTSLVVGSLQTLILRSYAPNLLCKVPTLLLELNGGLEGRSDVFPCC